MNCPGIIKFTPFTKENPLVVSKKLYQEVVKRYGQKEVEEMNIVLNQKAPGQLPLFKK
jgi:hypothetical protein